MATLSSCQALSAARSIIQSSVLVNAFCQPEELRGSSGAPVVLTDTVACRTLYAWRAGGALQRLTLRPTCNFRLTGSHAETRHHVCMSGVAQQPGDDGGRRVASFRTGDIYLVLEKNIYIQREAATYQTRRSRPHFCKDKKCLISDE